MWRSAIVPEARHAACSVAGVARRILLGTFMLLALAGPAWAGDAGTDGRFHDLDRNGDGFVSRDEGRDAEELNTRFSELDANNDGKLSRDEYAVLAREAGGQKEKHAGAAGASRPRNRKTPSGEN